MNIVLTDIAWAAGLFEGEGCITKYERHIRLALGQTDLDVLRRFQHVLGAGKIYGPYDRSDYFGKCRKPMYEWRVSGFEKTQAVLAMLWPWLHNRKRTRAKEILAYGRSQRLRRWWKRPALQTVVSPELAAP